MAAGTRARLGGRGRWGAPWGLLAALVVLAGGACEHTPEGGALGRVAWVRGDSLLERPLPAGVVHLVATARGIREPRWSPSGQWLALRTDSVLRLMRLDGSGGQKLASQAAEYAWAPTDDRIAYIAEGNLIVARAGGIGVVLFERTATSAALGVSWSPDGRWIAFGVEPASGGVQPAPPSAAGLPGLMVVPARGGSPRPLPLPTVPMTGPPLIRGWTADGAVVVAIPAVAERATTTRLRVYALPVAGGEADSAGRRSASAGPALLADSVFPYADFIAPAPKSPAVAVVVGTGPETWANKAVILTAGGTRTRLSAPGRAAISPAWSPDGSRLAWADMPEAAVPAGGDARIPLQSRRIVLAVMNAGAAATARPLGGEAGRQESPRWLRDGRHLLYVRIDSTGAGSLRLGAEGEPERMVEPLLRAATATSAPGQYGFVPWSDVLDYWPGRPRDSRRLR